MPHDRNGERLNVGDSVTVPCVIKAIHDTEFYCNVDLETDLRVYPTAKKSSFTLNAKQVEKTAK